MQYVPPLGATDPNAPYIEGNPQAAIRGSYPTAFAFESMMREIVAICAAGKNPPTGANNEAIAAIKYLIAQAALKPANGRGLDATAGGLGLNFDNMQGLITPNAADKVALYSEISEGGLPAGTPFSTTLANLGAYIASLFQQNATFTRIDPNNLVGMSLATTGDYAIPRGILTRIPLSAVTVNPDFGSVFNGILTVKKAGFYEFNIATTMYLSTTHGDDFVTLKYVVTAGGGGNPLGGPVRVPPGGGQTSTGILTSFQTKLNANDTVFIQALGDNYPT